MVKTQSILVVRHPFRFTAVLALAVALFAAPAAAQVVRQLTDLKRSVFSVRRSGFDDAGTVLHFSSTSPSFGRNAEHELRIATWDHATNAGTSIPAIQPQCPPSVSDDGAWLAFTSSSNPTGDNADGSAELFLASSDGLTVVQLTQVDGPDSGSVIDAELAGSGNRIAFVSDADLAGLNPGGDPGLFVIEADGTNLRRLGSSLTGNLWLSGLSDDGERVLFRHDGDPLSANADGSRELFAILQDGSDLRQVTDDPGHVTVATISGDGSRIAFQRDGRVFVLDWSGGGLTDAGRGAAPSLTDDGNTLYYAGADGGLNQVQRVDLTVGPTPVALTSDGFTHHCCVVVSGDGNRLAYRTSPDNDRFQLRVMNVDATDKRKLGEHGPQRLAAFEPDLTADGSRIVFGSNADMLTNPDYFDQLFIMEVDRGNLYQITHHSLALAWHPRITADGNSVIFMSYSDLTGVESGTTGYQKTFKISANGTGLTQISEINGLGEHADVSDDGSTVVLQGIGGITRLDLDGGNPLGLAPVSGRAHPRINANGDWVVYHSVGSPSLFRAATDGSLVEALTADSAYYPSISADGSRIAYMSNGDPLGTNVDGNFEIFVYEPFSTSLRQLTVSTGGDCLEPAISGNGAWVYFKSEAPLTDATPPTGFDLYRVPAAGGAVQRAGGLGGGGSHGWGSSRNTTQLEVDASGNRAVITLSADWTLGNPDLTQELFLIDFDETPQLRFGGTDRTMLTWDVAAGPLDYDVIRGDVANLTLTATEETDLGPVVCIENDSTDNVAFDFEDPQPGQTFFYIFRGSQGSLSGPGSWDSGTSGGRFGGDGTCAD